MQCPPKLVQTLSSKATRMYLTQTGVRKLRSSPASLTARHPTQAQKKRRKRKRRWRNTPKTAKLLMTDGSVGAIVLARCRARAQRPTRMTNSLGEKAIIRSSPF